ncbi:MAG: acyl-CoA dehydrogenase family protein, partial [Dehalococcoidia bacterium]|nr:acyl-CoA dehydrogenase family protein [Dehalococcoidia bacterium]
MQLDIKDYKLPRDLERYRKAVREFVLTDLEAISEKMEDTLSTPKELVPKLAKAGLLSLTFPKRLGGYELTPTQFFPILEEVAGTAGAIRLIVHTWDGIYSRQVLEYGSEAQIQKYMAPMARGEKCVA